MRGLASICSAKEKEKKGKRRKLAFSIRVGREKVFNIRFKVAGEGQREMEGVVLLRGIRKEGRKGGRFLGQ